MNKHLESINRIDFADYFYDEDENRFYLCNTEDFLLLPEKSDAEKIANMVELGVGPNEIKARLKAQAIHDTQKRLAPPSPIIRKSVSSGPLAYNEKDDQYSFKIKIKTVEPDTELPK